MLDILATDQNRLTVGTGDGWVIVYVYSRAKDEYFSFFYHYGTLRYSTKGEDFLPQNITYVY